MLSSPIVHFLFVVWIINVQCHLYLNDFTSRCHHPSIQRFPDSTYYRECFLLISLQLVKSCCTLIFFKKNHNYTINTLPYLFGMLQQKALFRSIGECWQLKFCQFVDISFEVQAACNSNTSNTLITIIYRYKLMMNYNFTKNCKHFAQLSVLSFRQSALLMINKLTNTQLEWTTSRQYKKKEKKMFSLQ